MSFCKRAIALTGVMACLAWPALSAALSFDSSQGPGGLAEAIVADGAAPDAIDAYVANLFRSGVAFGDATEALLVAGYGTAAVVGAVLGAGGNEAVIEVVGRVFYVQGETFLDLVRSSAYAVPGIDRELVDRAIAMYLGKLHLPIRDPGATDEAQLPDRPVSNF